MSALFDLSDHVSYLPAVFYDVVARRDEKTRLVCEAKSTSTRRYNDCARGRKSIPRVSQASLVSKGLTAGRMHGRWRDSGTGNSRGQAAADDPPTPPVWFLCRARARRSVGFCQRPSVRGEAPDR